MIFAVLAAEAPHAALAQTVDDSTALRAWVDDYREVFNSYRAGALAGFFDDDADMVIGNGPYIRGRSAIERWWQAYFEVQEPARTLSLEVISIRLPLLGVGLVQLSTTTGVRDSSGRMSRPRHGRGTWVVAPRDDGWSILALRALPTERDSVVLTPYASAAEVEESETPADIGDFVDSYQNAFNTRDPAAVTAFYTDDADIIIRNLPLSRGRQAIEEYWRAHFSTRPYYSDSELRIRFAVVGVRMIVPNAALIDLVAGADRAVEERDTPTRVARATWVLLRKGGGWRIAALRVLPSEHDRVIRDYELTGPAGDCLTSPEGCGS